MKLRCLLLGHADLLDFDRQANVSTVALKCQTCGRTTPGITVRRPPAISVKVERFRRRLREVRTA